MIQMLIIKLQNNKRYLLEQALAMCAATFSRLSLFIIVLINTHFFSPKDFGIFSIVLLIANIVNATVSCGGDMWLNRFTRPHHTYKKRAPIVSRFYLHISIAIASLVALIALLLNFSNINILEEYRFTILYSLIWAISGGLIETILAILRTMSDIKRFFIIRDLVMPALLIIGIFIFKIHSVSNFFYTHPLYG